MNVNRWLYFILISIVFQSCGLLGIHFKVHNPNKPGKLPKFSEESILLGEMTPLRSCYDVKYYDLSIDVNTDEKSLSGVVQIHAKAEINFDSLQIDLHPNFTITKLIDFNSKKVLNYQRKERAVFIQLQQQKGQSFIIEIAYNGKPYKAKKAPWKGGFVWKKDKEKQPWIGVACESDGASIWWPLKDHTADEPDSMRLHYTVPKGLTAVGNGQLESTQKQEATSTFNWFISYPINTYNVSIYVGAFNRLIDTYEGINGQQLEMVYYVLNEHKDIAMDHFKQSHKILKCYEEKFGEYPWYNDGFKLIESPYAGMEHQTAIAYGNGYKNSPSTGIDYIILHEIAHEWWGNSVTATDLADVWIQEGFATYAESLFFEYDAGKEKYQDNILFNRLLIKNKYPVVGVRDRRWFHFRKGMDVYIKGAWILHTLRNQIDDDAVFFDIITSFYNKHKVQLVDSEDFIRVVNEKTGKDYHWFFEQYLNNNFAPTLEYAHTKDGLLYYRWINVTDSFNDLKVDLYFNGKKHQVVPSTKVQTIQLTPNHEGKWKYFFDGRESLFATEKSKKVLK